MLKRIAEALTSKLRPRPVVIESGVDDMIPGAEAANYVGGGSVELFKEIGLELLGWLKLYADLKPSEKILDVGCGIGRLAIPLTQYLDKGTYDGFDIIPHGIEWCQKRITPRYPNFRFYHADIYNQYYNPGGTQKASQYTFPFPDGEFDVVVLTSVFTHMLPADLERYVQEISRVLKPAGRCFCSAFVISPEARDHLERGHSIRGFEPQSEGYWTDNPGNPEAAIGYAEDYLKGVFAQSDLPVSRIIAGGWWGHPAAQDILIARQQ